MGVGKSALTKHVLHRVIDRNVFLGGMLFVHARGISTVETLLDELIATLVRGFVCKKAREEFNDKTRYC